MCGNWHVRLIATEGSRGPEAGAGVGLVAVMSHDNRWGLVCDDRWNDNAARLICTCLGYTRSVCLSVRLSVHLPCLSVCLSVCVLLGLMQTS